MKNMQENTIARATSSERILGRQVARELTREEIAEVSGGRPGISYHCGCPVDSCEC
jgi:hypothetical protein